MIARLFPITLVALFLSTSVCAQEVNLAVTLSKLDAVRTSEKRGDELYVSITEYNSSTSPINYRIPEFPLHWKSNGSKEITNALLWANTFKEGEGASVIFSLIEQDTPPWNLDDLIGTIKLKVRNEKGKLKSEWVIPHQAGYQVIPEHQNAFILKGNNVEYYMVLKLEETKDKPNFIKKRDNLIRPNPFSGL